MSNSANDNASVNGDESQGFFVEVLHSYVRVVRRIARNPWLLALVVIFYVIFGFFYFQVVRTPVDEVDPPISTEDPEESLMIFEDGEPGRAWRFTVRHREQIAFDQSTRVLARLETEESSYQADFEQRFPSPLPENTEVCVEILASAFVVALPEAVTCKRPLPQEAFPEEWGFSLLPKENISGVQDVVFSLSFATSGSPTQTATFDRRIQIEKGLLDRYPGVAAALFTGMLAVLSAITAAIFRR